MNPNDRSFKNALYEQFARIGKAVSNPHRLELLDLLAQAERRVDDLARETDQSVANISQHLQILRQARLVSSRREGTSIYYGIGGGPVEDLWHAIRAAGESQLAEIDQLTREYLQDRSRFQAINVQQLSRLLEQEDVLLIDVRPQPEYQAGHLPNARSIPIAELEHRIAELPSDKQIVAYCRGPYCVYADQAVALLSANGFRVARLDDGLPEWRRAGFPVEQHQ